MKKRLNDSGTETMRVNSHHLKNRLLGLCPEIRSFNQGRDCYIAFDEDIRDILKDAKERNYDDDAVVLAKAADIIRRELEQRFHGPWIKLIAKRNAYQKLSLGSFRWYYVAPISKLTSIIHPLNKQILPLVG